MNNIRSASIAIAIVIIGLIGYVTANKVLKNNAVDNCAKLATSVKQGDYVIPLYQSCMRDKGYEISVK